MNKNIVIGIVVLVVIIFLVKSFRGNDKELGQGAIDNGASGFIVGKNALNVDEQTIGTVAEISLVILEKNGYVVVHEIVNEEPGKVLGASAFLQAGKSESVGFTLTEPLQEGKNYIAMLHLDNGDGIFNIDTDSVAKNDDADGSPVMMEFQTSVGGGGDGKSI